VQELEGMINALKEELQQKEVKLSEIQQTVNEFQRQLALKDKRINEQDSTLAKLQ